MFENVIFGARKNEFGKLFTTVLTWDIFGTYSFTKRKCFMNKIKFSFMDSFSNEKDFLKIHVNYNITDTFIKARAQTIFTRNSCRSTAKVK